MGSQPIWVRITLTALLLLTAGDLAVCDVLFPATCELERSENTGGDQAPSPDGCFCCCTHVVPVARCEVDPTQGDMPSVAALEARQPASAPSCIFHPPKA
jgi:hypothetical protein